MKAQASPAAQLRFLQRLAPGARNERPAVRAALPSRFAASDAQGLLTEQVSELQADAAELGMEQHSAPSRAARDLRSPTREITEPAAPPAQHASPMHALTASQTPPPGWPSPQNFSLEPAASFAAAVDAALGTPPRPMRAAAASDAFDPRAAWLARRDPEPDAHPLPQSLLDAAPSPIDVHAPLRESAVAYGKASSHASTPAPAVVHVTIDRIDVHTPASAVAAPALPKPRSPSMLSLSDYLRQNDRARGGGRP